MAPKKRRFPFPLLLLLLLAVAGAVAAYVALKPAEDTAEDVPVWTVRRGPLRVTVLEGGTLEALDSYTVVSRVEGQAAILSIVEEGSVLTAEDVASGKIIVQLDTAEIDEKIERQKIEVASARSAYENAVSNLVIQRQQNASDVRKAELDVRFAWLDLARYVGRGLVDPLVAAHRADTGLATGEDEAAEPIPEVMAGAPDGGGPDPSEPTRLRRAILTLLQNEQLEGEARQVARQLESDIRLAEEEFQRAQVEYEWSKQLEEKGYVSREEAEADRIALERRRIERERAQIAREQFVTYDFPKEVESLLSGLIEAEDQLSRTLKRAESAEAKAVSDVESRREQDALQSARLQKLLEQREACVIRAERPGLVVYASSGRRRRWDQGDRIQEGATVRERQPIITIPDLAQLGVKADIHESVVERVKEGQSASIVVDALPDQPIHGQVVSVAPLPNPAESWFNPDRKVYATTISLEHVPPTLRPGMSGQVEILVADLADVLLLPVQAVTGTAGRPTVYVQGPDGAQPHEVELGLSNDRFVQVISGVEVGDDVLLAPPVPSSLVDRSGRRGAGRPAGARDKADPGAPGGPGRPAPGAGAPPGTGAAPQEGGRGGGARPEGARSGGRRPGTTPGSR